MTDKAVVCSVLENTACQCTLGFKTLSSEMSSEVALHSYVENGRSLLDRQFNALQQAIQQTSAKAWLAQQLSSCSLCLQGLIKLGSFIWTNTWW